MEQFRIRQPARLSLSMLDTNSCPIGSAGG